MTEFKKGNFLLYSLGRLVSLIGAGVQMIALPLYILDVTGSGTIMGIFTLLSILPRLLATPFAGVFGDRWNRKSIMVYTDYARGIVIYLLWFIGLFGKLNITVLFTGTAIVAVFDAFFSGATIAMLPDIVPTEHLKKANSIMGFVSSVSMIIGPVFGGVLYGFMGIQEVFLINATCFTLSAVSEMFILYRPELKNTKMTLARFFSELKEGATFVFSRRGLKFLFLCAMVINFLSSPIFYVIFPFTLKTVIGFSSEQYGYLQTFFTLGALLGNLFIMKFMLKASNKKMMFFGLIFQFFFLLLFNFTLFRPLLTNLRTQLWVFFWMSGTFFAGTGFFNAMVNVPIYTNLQIMTPTEIRSRVFSVLELLAQIMVPLGSVIFGFLIDRIPIHWFFLGVNTLCLLVVLVFFVIAPPESFNPHLEKQSLLKK